MIHECPVCGWRYGHSPECPLRREAAIWASREAAVWWLCIGVTFEFVIFVLASG